MIASLYFQGFINRTKAISSGRKGQGIFQHLKDIGRLLKKGTIYSTTASVVFRIAPSAYFASIIAALLVLPLDILPFGQQKALFSFDGDFIFFAYVLGLGKFFMILGALDTGSSFQGMGANREAFFNALAEPAFFILMGSFAMLSGHSSFTDIYREIHDLQVGSHVSMLLSILATWILIQIMMIENSRMPMDDPKTHLELTMIHEVMILDHSGVDLGMIMYGTSLKFAMFGTIIANFFITITDNWLLKIALFFGIQSALAVIAGLLESFRARTRMKRNAQVIFTLTALCILIFFGVLIIMNKFRS